MDQTVHDPKGESLVSRVVRPMVLLAPLTIGLLLFGTIYGWRSYQLAAEIDAHAPFLVIDSPDGDRVAPDRLCPDAGGELAELRFHRLDLDDPSRKSTISGLGFDRGAIDVKGWMKDPSGGADTAATDGNPAHTGSEPAEPVAGNDGEASTGGGTTARVTDPAARDNRDDISLELQRSEGIWCVFDVTVR